MALRTCPRCSNDRVYDVRRGKCRCARCKYEWIPNRLPLHLKEQEWRHLLRPFLEEKSGKVISDETGIHRQRILRALTVLRMVMGRDVPQVLEGKVKVDARYSTGKASRRFPASTDPAGKHRTGTAHPPIYGIWYSQGKVWASLMREPEANHFLSLLQEGAASDDRAAVDADSDYSGIAYNGRFYRMNNTTITEDRNAYATDDGLYNFGNYLTKRLAPRRGLRRDRLPLYLAECVWRFNHRDAPVPRQEEKLLDLLHRY